ncbi:hypothetical protein [Pseudonocardia zijingensis]|jgi:hypothetical protein|uniref:Uncharacterized protein n=1 Tax=Pseudonocardia zijingensis TaxID=153376 RepID=A0ABN1P8A9_9PSEU
MTSDFDSPSISPSEQLDEDELGADPLEEGAEAPEPTETWSGADQHGPTPREQRDGQSLDERLAQEESDVEPEI